MVNTKTFFQLVKFGFVGVINTLVTLGIIFLTTELLGIQIYAGNFLGYACGVTVSFFLNKNLTFQSSGQSLKKAILFLMVFGFCYLIQVFVLTMAREHGFSKMVSQLLGMLVYTPLSFLLNKTITFRAQEVKNEN